MTKGSARTRGARMFGAYPKANHGPGGWKCSCCRIGPLSYHKRMAHRIARHNLNQTLRSGYEPV